jgi:DHA2 family multidrug resistance protein
MRDLDTQPWVPKHNPWLIAITVSMATFMEVLDTSVANVALPHIAGSFGASQDESTWVLTSYLVSNAVILPLAAYMSTLLGRKRFYMMCVALFGISSLLCGLAPTLPLLLFFRVLQGLGGGGLGPSEQSILADTFPPAKRGQAFALYGLAIVMAPTLGPTVGGWITDNFDWRWIFFINLPIVALSLYMTNRLVEDTPTIVREVEVAREN